MYSGKSDTAKTPDGVDRSWPLWARWAATLAILFHVAAVLAGAFAASPSSELEHRAADLFAPYHQAAKLGESYRYYSTPFGPTPVLTATLTFADGRPEQVVRIPDRSLKPRLLYQRQLAMAHFVMEDFEASKHSHDDNGPKNPWASAFAVHLGKTHPGCTSVTLHVETHLIPRIEHVQELLARPGSGPLDLDSEEFSTAPERIGVYHCNAS